MIEAFPETLFFCPTVFSSFMFSREHLWQRKLSLKKKSPLGTDIVAKKSRPPKKFLAKTSERIQSSFYLLLQCKARSIDLRKKKCLPLNFCREDCPTVLFTVLEPRDQDIGEFYKVALKRIFCLKLQNCERVGLVAAAVIPTPGRNLPKNSNFL